MSDPREYMEGHPSPRQFTSSSREIVLDRHRVAILTVIFLLVGFGIFFAGVRYGKKVEKLHASLSKQDRFFVAEDILPPMEVQVPPAAAKVAPPQPPMAVEPLKEEKAPEVAVEPPKAVEKATPASAEKSLYAIQVAALHNRKDAEKVVRDLKKKGFSAYLGPTHYGSSGKLYRAWVGNYAQKEDARKVMADLGKQTKRSTFLVSLNQNQGGSERGSQAVSQARR